MFMVIVVTVVVVLMVTVIVVVGRRVEGGGGGGRKGKREMGQGYLRQVHHIASASLTTAASSAPQPPASGSPGMHAAR